MAIGAPVIEEAAKGLFLLLMMTGRRRNELNSLTDCLVYAGFVAAGFAWLENIFYIAMGETIAHLNHLWRRGRARRTIADDGAIRYAA